MLITCWKTLEKEPIAKLTDFVDIDRLDIVTEQNIEHLETMSEGLFKLFDKKECRYYPKKSKSWVLNVLRGIVKSIGYNLDYKETRVYKGKYGRTSLAYQIKK